MSRRGFLGLAALAAAAGLTLGTGPTRALAADAWPRTTRFRGFNERHLTVRQIGRAEEAQACFRTRAGIPDAVAINRLSWLFRDWRDDDMGLEIDVRLFDVLATMQTLLTAVEDRPVVLLLHSGYRTPERNRTIEGAAVHSQHIVGKAADISVHGVAHERIGDLGEIAGAHGLGRYDDFTHVDVGRRGRRWTG